MKKFIEGMWLNFALYGLGMLFINFGETNNELNGGILLQVMALTGAVVFVMIEVYEKQLLMRKEGKA